MNVGPAAASDAQAAQQIGGREENVVKIEDDPQYVEFFKMYAFLIWRGLGQLLPGSDCFPSPTSAGYGSVCQRTQLNKK